MKTPRHIDEGPSRVWCFTASPERGRLFSAPQRVNLAYRNKAKRVWQAQKYADAVGDLTRAPIG